MVRLQLFRGRAKWRRGDDSVGFPARFGDEQIECLVTCEALAFLTNADGDLLDGPAAITAFQQHEAAVHDVARREWKRTRDNPLVLRRYMFQG